MADDSPDVSMRDASTASAMDITSIVNPSSSSQRSSSPQPPASSSTSQPELNDTNNDSTSPSAASAAAANNSLTSKSEDSRTRALLEEKFADQVRDLKQKLDRLTMVPPSSSSSTSPPTTTTTANEGRNKMDIKSLVDPRPSSTSSSQTNDADENPFLSSRTKYNTTSGSGTGGLSSFASLLASLNEEMSKMPDDEVEKVGEQVEGIMKMGSSGNNNNNKNSSTAATTATTGTAAGTAAGTSVEPKEQSDDR